MALPPPAHTSHRDPGRQRSLRPARCALAGSLLLGGASLAAAGTVAAATSPPHAGIASLPAGKVLAQAEAALKQANNVWLLGGLVENGAKFGLNIKSANRGTESAGSVDSQSASLGFVGTLKFVETATAVYLNADSHFWNKALAGSNLSPTVLKHVLTVISNRWIEYTGSSAASFKTGFSKLTNPVQLAGLFAGNTGTLSKGAATVKRGQNVLPIHSSKGGTLYVALTGPPLPVELDGGSGNSGGTLLFRYPGTVNIQPPAQSETLQQLAASIGAG